MTTPARIHPWSGLLVLGLLGGCASAPQAVQPAGEPPVTVALRVEARPRGTEQLRLIESGDTLRSGDAIALRVEVDRPAYVYVAQVAREGQPAVLFPEHGDRQIAPGMPVRLPEAGKWLEVDDSTGEESVYVVATTRPLAQADQGLAELLRPAGAPDALSGDKKPPPPPPPPPPGNVDITTRGRRLPGPARTLRALTDDAGVAVLRFTFRHERL